MFERIAKNIQKRREKRKERLLKKNAYLRSIGKDPHKGWNQMINSGPGSQSYGAGGENSYFVAEEQKRLSQELQQTNEKVIQKVL